MSRSLIQVANQSSQTISANSIITLGSVQRRFGCACKLSGNAIELTEPGYYLVDLVVTATPTAVGNVTIVLNEDGDNVQGAIGVGGVSTVGNSVTIPIVATIRKGCCDASVSNLTVVLTGGEGVINNISMRVEKA